MAGFLALLVLAIIGFAIAMVFGLIFFVLKLVFWAVFFPIRLILKLLWIPVALLFGGGLLMIGVIAALFALLIPALPIVLFGLLLWAIFRRRPAIA